MGYLPTYRGSLSEVTNFVHLLHDALFLDGRQLLQRVLKHAELLPVKVLDDDEGVEASGDERVGGALAVVPITAELLSAVDP